MEKAGIFSKDDRVALEKGANGLLRERPEPNLMSDPSLPNFPDGYPITRPRAA
jgi:hypothetical protein